MSSFFDPFNAIPQQPDIDEDTCIACGGTLNEGDMVLHENSGGFIHAACCGPDSDGYCDENGEPLKDGAPTPEPFAYENDFSFNGNLLAGRTTESGDE